MFSGTCSHCSTNCSFHCSVIYQWSLMALSVVTKCLFWFPSIRRKYRQTCWHANETNKALVELIWCLINRCNQKETKISEQWTYIVADIYVWKLKDRSYGWFKQGSVLKTEFSLEVIYINRGVTFVDPKVVCSAARQGTIRLLPGLMFLCYQKRTIIIPLHWEISRYLKLRPGMT